MGTAGSVEMKIKDEVDEATDRRLIKKHTSQPLNILPSAKSKKSDGMKQSQSLYSLEVGVAPNLQLTSTKENELKLAKEQEFQALLNKNKKLDTENSRLRAELQALNRLCQKLRAERDTASDSCHDATRRAISLDQDRGKIQRQFKIFRETKESEIQALLQEKRNLEAKLHRMQAHGVATVDDHKFKSNVEIGKERPLIPDSPTPPYHWWGAAESETTSLFGSYVHMQNAAIPESDGSLNELKNDEDNGLGPSNADWKLASSNYFESSGMLPPYIDSGYIDRNYLRVYITGTPDCREHMVSILESDKLKTIKDGYQKYGYFLSVFSLAGINFSDGVSFQKSSLATEEILEHAIKISDLVIFIIGQDRGRFTEYEYSVLADSCVRKKTTVSYLFSKVPTQRNSPALSQIVQEIKDSGQSSKLITNTEEAVSASLVEIDRLTRLELGIDVDGTVSSSDEVGLVDDLLLDDDIELEQRVIASAKDNHIANLDFQNYYERLDEFVSSLGPTPPILIFGYPGAGKTSLIKSWIERLHAVQQNFLVFQHFVTSKESATADPVMVMRRLLRQMSCYLPAYLVPPSFILSSYDFNHLRVSLLKWLDRLSTMSKRQIILVIDSVDLINDVDKHFKWLLDPLPVGVRVIISVGVNGFPTAWKQWPTITLEPISAVDVQRLLSEIFTLEKAAPLRPLESEILFHCRTTDTCRLLYLSVLTNILCSTMPTDSKRNLMKHCLQTCNCCELYHAVLKYIEQEYMDSHFQKDFRLILKLILSTREGINENLIIQILSHIPWETWIRTRMLLTKFSIIVERAGLVKINNSLVFSVLLEMLRNRKVTEGSTSTTLLIRAVAQTSSSKYKTTSSLFPWLLRKAERKSDLRQCLLHPHVFHNLYTSGRAGEVIQYWQYVGEDKRGIIEQYNRLLASLNDVVSGEEDSSGGFFAKDDSNLSQLTVASVYESVGRFLRDLGVSDMAATCIERTIEIRESELDPDHHLVANSLHYQGTVYTKWRKYAVAEPLFKHSLELVECFIGREHPRVIQELQSLTFVCRKLEKHEEADSIAKRMSSVRNGNGGHLFTLARFLRLEMRTALLEELADGEDSLSTANVMNDFGISFYMQKNYNSAESFLKKSLDMRIRLLGDNDADVAQSLHNLSAVFNEQMQYCKAMECMKEAYKIRRQVFGKHNPIVLSTAAHLAILCKKSRKFESARFLYHDMLEMAKESHGCDSLAAAHSMVNLGVVESHLGNHKAALPLYETALGIYESRRGSSSKEVAATLRNIAILRYDDEDYEGAADVYKRSMAIKEQLRSMATNPPI